MRSLLKKINKSNGIVSFKLMTLNKNLLIFCHDILALFVAMHLSMWLVFKNDLSLIEPTFVLKESLIFALISSGFFLWFQTYRGVWRYISWRQSALIIGVLGFASLIFFPLVTKAHMQPIAVPAFIVPINWAIASILLIGSRLFFRVFQERWSQSSENVFLQTPLARIILVGSGRETKKFIRNLNRQKGHLYEILGFVETTAQLDKTIEGVKALGSLTDLPDLIENFNTEGMHPHYLVFTGTHYFGSKIKTLLKNLTDFQVGFMKIQDDSIQLNPVSIEDIFHEKKETAPLRSFYGKNILIYGASSPLGKEAAKILSHNICANLVLWDHNIEALEKLKRTLHHINSDEKSILFSKASCDKKQLATYLKDHKIDIFLNLKSCSALAIENYDPSSSFETYIEDNEAIIEACKKAAVSSYYFITQETPHKPLSTSLKPFSDYILSIHEKDFKNSCAAIHLPYILSQDAPFFNGTSPISIINSASLPVFSPKSAALVLGDILLANSQSMPWSPEEFQKVKKVSFDNLAEIYSCLNHNKSVTPYILKKQKKKTFSWQEETYKDLQKSIKNMDYKKALSEVNEFYS